MAEKKATKDQLAEGRRALLRGEQIPAGLCYDPDRYPEEFYPCSELEERVARGEVSVSWDGTKVTDLKTGVTEDRDVPPKVVPTSGATGAGTVTGTGNRTVTTEGAHP